MFFIASKILGYLLTPILWAIILLIASSILKKKSLLIAGIAVLFIFGNPFVFRIAINNWESPISELPTTTDTTKAVVLLGGYTSHNDQYKRIRFHQSSDRLLQALLLMQKNNLSTLILSGGSPNILLKERPEAAFIEEALYELGMDHINIVADSVSRNTYENAVNSRKICDSLNIKKDVFLVTSSFHHRRANACFIKQGFEVTPITCDPLGSVEKISFNEFIIPSSATIGAWHILFREWVGIAAYKFKGYI